MISGSLSSWMSGKYIPFSRTRQDMLALWSFFWTSLGERRLTWIFLPSVRIRISCSGRVFIAGHIRVRPCTISRPNTRGYYIRRAVGFVVFSNVNAVTEVIHGPVLLLHPAGGAGLRVKFNKHSGGVLILRWILLPVKGVRLLYGVGRGILGLPLAVYLLPRMGDEVTQR